MDKPKVASLCSGAGIGEIGIQPYFRTVLAADSWWQTCCSHMANHPEVRVMRGDIRNRALAEWCAAEFSGIDGVIATPPCPPFSRAGAHNRKDQRIGVFLALADWIEALRPRFVIVENVSGILRSPHFTIATQQLRQLGYEVGVWLLNAADFGAPQYRQRVFIVATRKGEAVPESPLPTHGSGHLPALTLREAIGDLNEKETLRLGCAALSPARAEIMAAVPPGGNWCDLTGWQREAALNSIKGRKPPSRLCRRYAWDETPGTLLTGAHVKTTTMPLPPHVNRPFTVLECLRLQGVRRPFWLIGSVKQRYAQVGNGVPVELMSAVCGAVARALAQTATQNPSQKFSNNYGGDSPAA